LISVGITDDFLRFNEAWRTKVQGTRYKMKAQGTRHKAQGTRHKAQDAKERIQLPGLKLSERLYLNLVLYFLKNNILLKLF